MGSSTTAWGRPLAMWSARQQSAAPGDFWRYVPSSGGLAIDAKSIPIHCVIEKTIAGTKPSRVIPDHQPVIDLDSYAIVPHNTPFGDVVRAALLKIGYTTAEAAGAKGTIHIRNWKPLTFDTITDNADATVEDILGEMTSVATLRIRLSKSRLSHLDEVKEKLLRLLVQHPHFSLLSSRCPIDKEQLGQICNGDNTVTLSDEDYTAFNKWYVDQLRLLQTGSSSSQNHGRESKTVTSDILQQRALAHHKTLPKLNLATSIKGSHPSPKFWSPLPALTPASSNGNGLVEGNGRVRSKTIFDPEHELPRLQRWFQANGRPSRQQMMVYLSELNSLDHRRKQGRPPLELASICCWFKNARAALRRSQVDDTSPHHSSSSCMSPRDAKTNEFMKSSPNHEQTSIANPPECDVPELPNKNAVYVINPLLSSPSRDTTVEVGATSPIIDPLVVNEEDGNDDQPQDLSCNSASFKREESFSAPLKAQTSWSDAEDSGASFEADNLVEDEISRSAIMAKSDSVFGRNWSASSSSVVTTARLTSPTSSLIPYHQQQQQQQQHAQQQHMSIQQQHSQQQRTAMQLAAMSYSLNLQQYMQTAANVGYSSPTVKNFPSLANGNDSVVGHAPFKKESDRASTSSSVDGGTSEKKKRTRVFIDPLTEIPRLEMWFAEDTHPSSYMIEKFSEELNNSPYRMRFPKLEAKNVQLWFKNHRAKVKRQKLDNSPLGASEGATMDEQHQQQNLDWMSVDTDDDESKSEVGCSMDEFNKDTLDNADPALHHNSGST